MAKKIPQGYILVPMSRPESSKPKPKKRVPEFLVWLGLALLVTLVSSGCLIILSLTQ
jgi:hypothetical protein